jgi:hypothetical protein
MYATATTGQTFRAQSDPRDATIGGRGIRHLQFIK